MLIKTRHLVIQMIISSNSINGASTQEPFDQQALIKYAAFFGRLKYVYDQKYILEFSGRRDGSSNFGPGNQFGTFGSVGAGLIFSEEKAFKDALPFISYGKLSEVTEQQEAMLTRVINSRHCMALTNMVTPHLSRVLSKTSLITYTILI